METVIEQSKETEIKAINQSLVEKGKQAALTIKDDASYEDALTCGKEIARRLKWFEDDFMGPIVDAAHKAWKAATSRREEIAGPLRQAKSDISRAAGFYESERARKRREEEARIEAELKKKIEDERLAAAANLEKQGLIEEMNEILDTPVEAPAVVLPSAPKVEGTSSRIVWKFKIVDESLIPRKFLRVDEAKIGQEVRTWKDKAEIPGVKAYPEPIATFGGRNG